jgi:hypothetical protein
VTIGAAHGLHHPDLHPAAVNGDVDHSKHAKDRRNERDDRQRALAAGILALRQALATFRL